MDNLLNALPYTIYCERANSTGLFAEPINTISNLAFFIAAYLIYQKLKKEKLNHSAFIFFPTILLLVGLGSAIWHTFNSGITLLADSIPIYSFFLVFLYLFLTALFQNKQKALLLVVFYAAIQLLFTAITPKDLFNGSIRHIINLILFLLLILASRNKFAAATKKLFLVFLVYSLAVILRTIDPTICTFNSLGTHFTWHILTAISAYYSVLVLIKINPNNHKIKRENRQKS